MLQGQFEFIFTVVNDRILAEKIMQAKHNLTFIAPGIGKETALALDQKIRNEQIPIQVILDVNSDVYRRGYGDVSGYKIAEEWVKSKLITVKHEPGLRIGMLTVDDSTIVYAPTSLLVEEEPEAHSQINALWLAKLIQLLESATVSTPATSTGNLSSSETVMPISTTPAIELGTNIVAPDSNPRLGEQEARPESKSQPEVQGSTTATSNNNTQRELGSKTATSEMMSKVSEDLKKNPPGDPAQQRKELDFSSKIQYVEFSMENYKLSTKTVSLPFVYSKSPEVRKRLKSTFTLVDKDRFTVEIPEPKGDKSSNGEDIEALKLHFEQVLAKNGIYNAQEKKVLAKYFEQVLEKEKQEVIEDFLINVPDHGSFILKTKCQEFAKKIERLKIWSKDLYKAKVDAEIEKEITHSVDTISEDVLPIIDPDEWFKEHKWGETFKDWVKRKLRVAMNKAFDKFDPEIKVVYKNLAYNTIENQDFKYALRKALSEKLEALSRAIPPTVYKSECEKLFKEYEFAVADYEKLFKELESTLAKK